MRMPASAARRWRATAGLTFVLDRRGPRARSSASRLLVGSGSVLTRGKAGEAGTAGSSSVGVWSRQPAKGLCPTGQPVGQPVG
nr:MAG TPA: hypothetical protein [Caudoviricetes sp.]